MKKFIFIVMIFVVMGISWFNPVFVLTSRAAALSSFVAATTVANVSGTDNQTAATSTTVANVAEVKASRTLTVGALPAASETITVGTCVISFTDVAS